jgi:hypothetical protein
MSEKKTKCPITKLSEVKISESIKSKTKRLETKMCDIPMSKIPKCPNPVSDFIDSDIRTFYPFPQLPVAIALTDSAFSLTCACKLPLGHI